MQHSARFCPPPSLFFNFQGTPTAAWISDFSKHSALSHATPTFCSTPPGFVPRHHDFLKHSARFSATPSLSNPFQGTPSAAQISDFSKHSAPFVPIRPDSRLFHLLGTPPGTRSSIPALPISPPLHRPAFPVWTTPPGIAPLPQVSTHHCFLEYFPCLLPQEHSHLIRL